MGPPRCADYGYTPAPPTLDGVVVAASQYNHGYTQVGEWHDALDGCDGGFPPGHMATMGIMVHEMGHDIDWPDLYDTDSGSAGVGYWSIMSGGSWGRASGDAYSGTTPVLPDAFLKWYQGWITPVPVTTPRRAWQFPILQRIPTPIYSVSTRRASIGISTIPRAQGSTFSSRTGSRWALMPDCDRIDRRNAHGCIIWHIDETRTIEQYGQCQPDAQARGRGRG